MLTLVIERLPFCPRNRSHSAIYNSKTKQAMVVKTEAGRSYEKALKQVIKKYAEEAKLLTAEFDPQKFGLFFQATYYTPEFYTKDGRISQTSTDLDAHKILQDVISGFIGIDDGYIIDSYTRKRYAEVFKYVIKIELISKPVKGELDDYELLS